MKLENKHLAPYLAFKLKCKWNKSVPYELVGLRNGNESVNNELWIWKDGMDYNTGYLYECVPVLLPISSITNDQLKEFYQFDTIDLELIDIEEWKEELVNMIKGNDKFQLSQFQKLFEWHIDVFGLIEKGLAVDINTLSV
jgi:hypothetical protein